MMKPLHTLRMLPLLPLWCALVAPAAMAGTTAIVNAAIHTAGPAGVIERGTLVMRDDRIVAVGKDVKVPDGATVIDGSGKTVTPGLFVPLSGLGVTEVEGVEDHDRPNNHKRYSAALDMGDAYNPRSLHIPIARADGITRAMVNPLPKKGASVLSGQGLVVSLGTAGWLVKPQAAMFAQFGEAGADLAGSRASALLALRESFEEVRLAGKAGKAGHAPNLDSLLSTLDIAALQPVLAGKTPLVITANRAADISAAIALARQYKLRLVIDGGDEAWLVARELAQHKVGVILDPEQQLPVSFESLGARPDNAKLLHEAGVVVAFTAIRGSLFTLRNLRQRAGNAINGGMDPQAALAAITLNPAKLFGVDQQVGSLAEGKQADVVLWDGDPFELSTYPAAVFIDGARMPDQNRQTRLRDKYMKLLQLK